VPVKSRKRKIRMVEVPWRSCQKAGYVSQSFRAGCYTEVPEISRLMGFDVNVVLNSIVGRDAGRSVKRKLGGREILGGQTWEFNEGRRAVISWPHLWAPEEKSKWGTMPHEAGAH